MKKVLFLMGRYIPNPSANSICVDNIIDDMLSRGIEVSCVCYDDFLFEKKTGVNIYRIKRNMLNSFLYKCEKKSGRKRLIEEKILRIFIKLKDVCFLHCWPYNEPIYWRVTYKFCEKLVVTEEYDTVISVYMPLSSLLVGNKLKEKFPKLTYIPYFLDSLSDGNKLRQFSDEWNFRKTFKWERKLLCNADLIIAMNSSKHHHDIVSKSETYYCKMRFLDIPLLKRPATCERDPFLHDKVNVVFSGTANYPLRNVKYILEVLKLFENEAVNFYFIGNSNYDALKKCQQSNILYVPYLPHSELLSYLQFADFYLNLGVSSPSAISGKIFELFHFS